MSHAGRVTDEISDFLPRPRTRGMESSDAFTRQREKIWEALS
jgi:hypothetical protein